MAQQPRDSHDHGTDLEHDVVLFPTGSAAHILAEPAAKSARRRAPGLPLVTSWEIREVAVLEVSGPLREAAEELGLAIQLALADGPPGVVADLSAVPGGVDPVAVEVLAMAGRHVRDWPAVPVAVVCADPRVREALAAHRLGRHLIVTASILSAVTTVLAAPTPAVHWLYLAPHPTAPRASRDFVTRTLLEWGMAPLAGPAGLVVRELVANSMHAGTDIDVSVAEHLGALRLTVRDNAPDLPGQPFSRHDPYARRLSVVAVLARAFGVLPTADGGRVVWAVLNSARPRIARE